MTSKKVSMTSKRIGTTSKKVGMTGLAIFRTPRQDAEIYHIK